MTNNPDRERERLVESYGKLSDGELEKTAGEAYELTDVAREVLRVELSRRGLELEMAEDPPTDEPEVRQRVTLRKFRDLPEALLAKGSLESAGIECALADDNMVRLDWFYSNAIGGIKLLVDEDDLEAAEQLLSQPIPENFEAESIGSYEQPKCPKCGSLDVTFQEINKPVAFVTAYFGVPVPLKRSAWRCHSCDVEWEEGDTPNAEQSTP